MKRVLLIFVVLANVASAQQLKVNHVEQLTTTKEGVFAWPEFIPESNKLLISKPGFKGLYMLNMRNKAIELITEEKGAGYQPAVSPDGKKIVYRSDTYKNGRKFQKLMEFDIKSNQKNQLTNESRNLSTPRFVNNKLVYKKDNEDESKIYTQMKIPQKRKEDMPYIRSENLKPVVYLNGKSKELLPNGEGNYIWASLSPDGSKMVYNYNGLGTYICNLEGEIIAELGHFHAPRWVNNKLLVGMNDKDDGHKIISSDIVCYSLKNKKMQNLTNTQEHLETYPMPYPAENKIAFHTEKGEIFILEYQITK